MELVIIFLLVALIAFLIIRGRRKERNLRLRKEHALLRSKEGLSGEVPPEASA